MLWLKTGREELVGYVYSEQEVGRMREVSAVILVAGTATATVRESCLNQQLGELQAGVKKGTALVGLVGITVLAAEEHHREGEDLVSQESLVILERVMPGW